MPKATPVSASASAWSGLSIVDNTALQYHDRIILNNSLAADHSIAGLDNGQQNGDVVTLINRGTKNLTLAAEDTTDEARNRFLSAIFIPAGGKAKVYYNGTRWEPFVDNPGGIITKMVPFIENATNTTHTGTIPVPAGAWLHDIQVINEALWGAASAAMKIGDSVDDDGYFVGIDLKATDLAVGEVLSMREGSIDVDGLWGGKQGAYLVAATGRRGPTATNFGMYQKAGTNIIGIIAVGTPGATTGRTYMIVSYSVPSSIAAVPTGP